MADEELTPAEGEPIDAPVPDEDLPEAQQQDDTPDPIASLASEMGWVPKEQFKGNPEQWRDATTFIRTGKDIQKSLARELKEVRSTVDNMARTSTTLFEQQMRAEREKLQARYVAAVDDGDHQQAFELSREIDKVSQAPKPAGPPPEAEAFVEKHSAWFGKDPLATQLAQDVSDRLAKQGYSVADQLAQAERAVRKEYPEHFPAPAKPQARVGEPQRTTSTSRKRGFADMPAAAQQVAREMAEKYPNITTEIYAANYFADQAKAQGGR